MEAWMRICGVGLIAAVCGVVLRQLGRDGALPLSWMGVVLLTGAAVGMLQPIVAFVGELAAACGVSEMSALLLRGLGVAMLTQLCADVCRQSGEGSIATGVECAGRAQLLLLALPQLRRLLSMAGELLSRHVP